MMPCSVIFDMDGVLFDTERLAVQAWDTVGEEIGLGKVGYMVFKTLGRTTEESVRIFEKEFGKRFNNDVFQMHYKAYLEKYYSEHPVPVKEGVYSLLRYLKENGFGVAVASSSTKQSVTHHLDHAGITSYFDQIICGDMVAKSKPEPDIYLTAAKALGVSPKDCYAVEDSRSGLWSAYRAGCQVIMVPDLYTADRETEAIINLTFHNLTEFEVYLNELHIGTSEIHP